MRLKEIPWTITFYNDFRLCKISRNAAERSFEFMANLILSEAQKLFEVSRFTGINHLVSGGTRVCRNFRIRPNGALEKRDGYMPVTTLPGLPRAVWCGNVFGEEMLFCHVDNVVYETD